MTGALDELIQYRLSRSFEAYEEALVLFNTDHWNACVNRLYYSCFYSVNALLVKNNFSSSKHSGVRALFNKEFIKTGIISIEMGAHYNELFGLRQESDYEDFFQVDKKTADSLLKETLNFINFIKNITE